MTIEEVLDPVMLPIAFGIALAAVLWLLWHVGRRYRGAPKIVPMGIRIDGRPGRVGPKAILWLAPCIIAAVLALLAVLFAFDSPKPEQRLVVALAIVLIAEVALLVAWITDRQIEMARKMTFRVAPSRLLRALLPLLATIVVLVFLGARP